MKIAVGIATMGRKETLSEAVAELCLQSRPADRILICATKEEDIDRGRLHSLGLPLEILIAAPGLTHQRNVILDRLVEDVVLFIDDDFIACPDYIASLEQILAANPEIVVLTAHPLADGARNAGIPLAEARAINAAAVPPARPSLKETYSGYGCNMAVLLAPLRSTGVRFNENLPLYGWLEDLDLSRRLAVHGRIMLSDALRGVHLAVKTGRSSGLRLGYSQVSNPIALYRNGLIPVSQLLSHVGRPMLANVLRAAQPEPYVDRRGRLKGNLLAVRDLLLRKCDPHVILTL